MGKQPTKESLKFSHEYVKAIVSGERTTTVRLASDRFSVGAVLRLVDKVDPNEPPTWLVPGELHITAVQSFMIKDVPLTILQDTELTGADHQELLTFARRYYGPSVDESSAIAVVTFTYVPYEQLASFTDQKAYVDGNIAHVRLYADGASRGNPGPSSAGYVIMNDQEDVLHRWNKYLGITTNNQAEYHALIEGLEWCKEHGVQELEVYLDSMLVVNQVRGSYQVKNRDLWTLYESAKQLYTSFKKARITHVPRALNKLADAEANKALDAVAKDDSID